jgi:hypothetical protein
VPDPPSSSSVAQSMRPDGSCTNSPTPSGMARPTCSFPTPTGRRTGLHALPRSYPDRAPISPVAFFFSWGVFAPNCELRARIVPSPAGATRKRHPCKRRDTSAPLNTPTLNDDDLPMAPMT